MMPRLYGPPQTATAYVLNPRQRPAANNPVRRPDRGTRPIADTADMHADRYLKEHFSTWTAEMKYMVRVNDL